MPICEKCGANVPDEAKFCTQCGAPVIATVLSDADCPQDNAGDSATTTPGDFKETVTAVKDEEPSFIDQERQNNYNASAYPQPYAQPYAVAAPVKKKFPVWAVILIVIAIIGVIGAGVGFIVFGVVSSVAGPANTVTAFCEASAKSDILKMADCLSDYAGYSEDDLKTELSSYMTDTESQQYACISALATFLYYFSEDYSMDTDLDFTNGIEKISCTVSSAEVHTGTDGTTASCGGTMEITAGGQSATYRFTADLVKIGEKWYISIG